MHCQLSDTYMSDYRQYHLFKLLAFTHSLVICQTTGPQPLPKRFLHLTRSRASSFKSEYPLLSPRSSSNFLRLLVTSFCPCIFPSITSFRRQFLRKIWPIQLALLDLIYLKKSLRYILLEIDLLSLFHLIYLLDKPVSHKHKFKMHVLILSMLINYSNTTLLHYESLILNIFIWVLPIASSRFGLSKPSKYFGDDDDRGSYRILTVLLLMHVA
jgi:hypothetical protein